MREPINHLVFKCPSCGKQIEADSFIDDSVELEENVKLFTSEVEALHRGLSPGCEVTSFYDLVMRSSYPIGLPMRNIVDVERDLESYYEGQRKETQS